MLPPTWIASVYFIGRLIPTAHLLSQSRREACTKLHHAARSWPPNGGQGPLGRAIAPNASTRRDVQAQQPALSKRRPRHFSSPFNGWKRRNRRASGASAGGKRDDDGRSRPESTGFLPAGGDRMIADCSAVNLRHCRITSATISLRLCVFASLRFSWCSPLVSWCLGGSKTVQHS